MRITQFFSSTSKNAHYMHYDYDHAYGEIIDRYVRPSKNKIISFENIRHEYCYNDTIILGVPCKTIIAPRSLKKLSGKMYIRYIKGTLKVAGAGSQFYSTTALFEDVETGIRYIVKETYANTYMCEL